SLETRGAKGATEGGVRSTGISQEDGCDEVPAASTATTENSSRPSVTDPVSYPRVMVTSLGQRGVHATAWCSGDPDPGYVNTISRTPRSAWARTVTERDVWPLSHWPVRGGS